MVLLFEESSREDAIHACTAILQETRKLTMADLPNQTITLSCGLAEMSSDMKTPADLFRAADAAMYRSKRNGKDQLQVHGQEEPPISTPA